MDLSLVAVIPHFPPPPKNVHPCLSIPPLEIAEVFERSHGYFDYILFFLAR